MSVNQIEDTSSDEDSANESVSTSDSDDEEVSIEESQAGTSVSAGIFFNFY